MTERRTLLSYHFRLTLFLVISVSAFVAGMSQQSKPANEGSLNNWKEFSSPAAGFKILFPKTPKESSWYVDVGRTRVVTHSYNVQAGASYSVMYLDVPLGDDPKITGNLLVGIRDFVLTELKGKLLTDNPISLDNNKGRLLEISLADGGVARAMIIVAGRRLFRVLAVPEKGLAREGDSAKTVLVSYLESFKLTGVDGSAEGEVDKYLRGAPDLVKRRIDPDGNLISGGLLNGKALSLAKPEYPEIARGVHAAGTVLVRVIIDEEGKVIAAQADSGHPLLHEPAVAAARKARFSPTLLMGKPVTVYGMITYNFVAP
jgi:TonB family protein